MHRQHVNIHAISFRELGTAVSKLGRQPKIGTLALRQTWVMQATA